MTFSLSADQITARDVLLAKLAAGERYVILTGYAGTGKTTLVKEIVRHLRGRNVVFCGSTGKAASNLARTVGSSASTIHALWYAEVHENEEGKPVFGGIQAPCGVGDVVVVDEASMIGRKLFSDMLKGIKLVEGAQMILVGDPMQLPPVKDRWGPNLERPDAHLHHVHRQALDNPLLAAATAMRAGSYDEWLGEYANDDDRFEVHEGMDDAIEWVVSHRQRGEEAVLLTYTNATRKILNHQLRMRLALSGHPISPGDTLVARASSAHHNVMNGEVFTVSQVLREQVVLGEKVIVFQSPEIKRSAAIVPRFLGEERGRFMGFLEDVKKTHPDYAPWFVHADYGQALTVHVSQGSQWTNVAVVLDEGFHNLEDREPTEAQRLLYTAMTRATQRLGFFYA